MERADDPCLLQHGQAAPRVQLAHVDRRLDDIQAIDDRSQLAQPEAARSAQPLEAVEHLDGSAPLERAHRRELPVLRERPAHRASALVGDTERREPLAELGHRDGALHGGSGGHGREPITTASPAILVRDAVHVQSGSRAIFQGRRRAS